MIHTLNFREDYQLDVSGPTASLLLHGEQIDGVAYLNVEDMKHLVGLFQDAISSIEGLQSFYMKGEKS